MGDAAKYALNGVRLLCFTFRMADSVFMRWAVAMCKLNSGFADDPADGRMRVAFFGAFPFDEDGAAFGGEGDAAGEEIGDC